jgi:mannose/cellobiose epimerase-like protein (N-acyl-D-glucosamine 2-epimerase family)
MMHLFEALLAYYDATGSKEVFAEAEAHGNAMFTKLFQDTGGYLPEFYDAEWKPLPESPQGHVELGHQFEWAYLWGQAVDKGLPRRDLQLYGERLLNFGMKAAYDAENGGIFSGGDYAGRPVKAPKGLWQQCEFLRALMNYAAVHNHNELWAPFDKSLGMFKEHFMDAQYGGCFSTYYDPKSPPEEAQLLKNAIDCYHVCGMYSEALRLTGVLG